mgnify:CR=1 FL=1
MGFLNKIGIGSAEVDTILDFDVVQPGADIPARIEIEGGTDDQEIEDIELAVMTRFEVETDEGTTYETEVITETELTNGFTIREGEQRTIDAGTIHIPESTPVTYGNTEVWIHTGLDIDWSVDPEDEDYLQVNPSPHLSALLQAVENLGFSRHSVKNTHAPRFGPHDFAQEFEFVPHGGRYASELDEIEVFPSQQGGVLNVVVEVDKRGMSIFGSDESHHRITVDTTDVSAIEKQIASLIDQQL